MQYLAHGAETHTTQVAAEDAGIPTALLLICIIFVLAVVVGCGIYFGKKHSKTAQYGKDTEIEHKDTE